MADVARANAEEIKLQLIAFIQFVNTVSHTLHLFTTVLVPALVTVTTMIAVLH